MREVIPAANVMRVVGDSIENLIVPHFGTPSDGFLGVTVAISHSAH
jgi:hypothetical protein